MEEVRIGPHRLLCGDAHDLLPALPSAGVCITDPPYSAITHAGARGGGFAQTDLIPFGSITASTAADLAVQLCAHTLRWVVMTMDWRHAAAIEERHPHLFIRAGIWVKPNGAPQFTGDRPGTGWESVVILHRPGKKQWNGGGQHAVWQVPRVNGEHPTEKPLALITQWVRQFARPGDTISDPFMGSGTTGVACVREGHSFLGIELQPDYFEMACVRIEQAYRQLPLFSTPAPHTLPLLSLFPQTSSMKGKEEL